MKTRTLVAANPLRRGGKVVVEAGAPVPADWPGRERLVGSGQARWVDDVDLAAEARATARTAAAAPAKRGAPSVFDRPELPRAPEFDDPGGA